MVAAWLAVSKTGFQPIEMHGNSFPIRSIFLDTVNCIGTFTSLSTLPRSDQFSRDSLLDTGMV